MQLLTPAAAAAPSPVEKSIVVLPFENISPDKDNEYFSDGLTEEVIADLSNIRTLRVISRSSAMTLKGTRKTVRTIGKELGVRYVLEGSVRKAGGQLRITAQLIDAATDAHLWTEKYNGTVEDIFAIQEKVSHSIAEALKLKLTTEEKAKLAQHPITNVQAYDCYLRARYAIHSWKEGELEQALELLNRALEQVGENALLYASQGYVYFQLVNAGYRQEEDLFKAEELAEKALALDPLSVHAHRLRAIIDMSFKGDQKSGCRHLKEALASDPFDAESLYWLAITYATFGKIDEARKFANRFLKVDPLSVITQLLQAGWIHFQDGRFDLAFVPLEKVYQIEPTTPLHRFAFGLALAYSGRAEEAIRFIDVLQRIDPPTFFDRVVLLLLYGLKGEKQ
ncbi:MAG: tetratricopeptide repeat protein, partial [candidate division Zixibacteria bacterium]|nr:tetratricopeptide repeat protein [candidate division Zixibacteria bacterium]